MKKMSLKLTLLVCSFSISSHLFGQSLEEGVKLYKYNRFASAKAVLEPLAATTPLANYYLGLCELGLENKESAKSIFQKYPDDAANTAGLARVMILENKIPEANSMLTKVASKAKKKDFLPLQYAADAITYTEGGDPNMAIDWYKKAMEVQRTGDLHLGIGDAYRKIQGGGGNAMNNYEYAEEFAETKSAANYKMGNLWYSAKNYDSALVKYAKASSLDDQNPLPYNDLANAYYKINKFNIAKENIEKYLKLSDNSIDDQVNYANILYLSKDYAGAIQKMTELINKGAERPYMYRVLGFSQFELKDYGNALQNMDKLFAKQDPKKIIPQDYMYYGKILMTDTNKAGQAATYFDKGIALDTASDKAPVYRGVAETYKDAQKYTEAAKWYKKVVDGNTPSIEALDYWWCGVMYYYAKDYVNAEPMLTLMSQKYPDEPSSYYWLARTTVNSKDKDYKNGAATTYFKKWLGMVNDDPAKKNDLIKAYTYLSLSSFNMKNKADATMYNEKLLALDPTNENGLGVQKALPSLK